MDGPELSIYTCRWVSDEKLMEVWRTLPPDTPIPPVYPGSITRPCQGCGEAVWVGPKGQEIMDHVVVCCFTCGVLITQQIAEDGDTVQLGNLGNTYVPPASDRSST